jgi:hypothetical protein
MGGRKITPSEFLSILWIVILINAGGLIAKEQAESKEMSLEEKFELQSENRGIVFGGVEEEVSAISCCWERV